MFLWKKIQNLTNRIKNYFKKSPLPGVRKVYFGLRSRYLGIMTLIMLFIIAALTIIMYLNHRAELEGEKNDKAALLVRILSGPAEFYLDKDVETSREEMRMKYNTIKKEALTFKKYNPDISKIFIVNEKGVVAYSTSRKDINQKINAPYMEKALIQNAEKLDFHDYVVKNKTGKKEYRSITYPIFLKEGTLINVLDDFQKYYYKFHASNLKTKVGIYWYLWDKYKNELGEEFDPKKFPKPEGFQEDVTRAWDADFVFHKLFAHLMNFRQKKKLRSEAWLWSENWLFQMKNQKIKAYINDTPAKANEINQIITDRMELLSTRIDQIRRLGALAVVFDLSQIKEGLNKNIRSVVKLALIIWLINAFLIFMLNSYILNNLKALESFALEMGRGNLDTKIVIRTRDEIGKLSDIFNLTLSELKMKLHLEKYVPQSARTIFAGQEKDHLSLGKIERRELAFIFSDVRGFTSFSEKNDPDTVMEVLNLYLSLQAQIIRQHQGDIDDYVGDEIMAHFAGKEKADKAVAAACHIIREIKELNQERALQNLPVFDVGIGVHEGDVVVGNIGTDFRMDFACIGDAVNLTSRLCSSAKAGEILVSKKLFDNVKKPYSTKELPPLMVKGKAQAIEIISIIV